MKRAGSYGPKPGQFCRFDTEWVLDGVFSNGSQYPKTWSEESEGVALACATRFCGGELRSPKSRKTPAPVPDADSSPGCFVVE